MQSDAQLQQNLHAAVLFAIVTAEYAYIFRNSWHLSMTVLGLLWAAFLIREWLSRRALIQPCPILSLREIVTIERRHIADSLFLLSPVLAVCTVVLGYVKRGYEGASAGVAAGAVYIAFVWCIHRYPVARPH
jgi:hypothetical protein